MCVCLNRISAIKNNKINNKGNTKYIIKQCLDEYAWHTAPLLPNNDPGEEEERLY